MRRRGRGAVPALLIRASSWMLLAAVSALEVTGIAHAGDVPGSTFDPSGFELRLGTFVHDSLSPERGSADINAEALMHLFRPAPSALSWLTPRWHVGTTINTAGKTSSLYTGLTWTFDLTPRLFAELSLGGAVHNGTIGRIPVAGHNAMGCRAAFRESLSLGYRFTQQFALMGTLEHMSNAGLCAQNRGLTNFGLRAAWTF
jgi:hypothetical protein